MPDPTRLLELSKNLARKAARELLSLRREDLREYEFSIDLQKEVKTKADEILDTLILDGLQETGLPVLTEESGFIQGKEESGLKFIVDPLDGTFNFIKNLGPSAVSIALWQENMPIHGVILNLYENKLYWGGPEIGAFCEDEPIRVSKESMKNRSSICTGFPTRFDVNNLGEQQKYWGLISPFAKVRMLGSAAVSLLQVAKGSSELYSESNIMLWDVAAGLSIVKGAGGNIECIETGSEWCLDVIASNGKLQ
jgi:myo-inositol-1(or 4)-monophosphatase